MTLIDLAIVLTVVGLLAVPALQSYQAWKAGRNAEITRENIKLINAVIAEFYFENGRYPCPADPGLDFNLPAAGQEACAAALDSGPLALAGSVPFATLKISANAALDGWQRKLKYAVSTNQSRTAATPMTASGSLELIGYTQTTDPVTGQKTCSSGASLLPDAGHYIVISLGTNGLGAVTPQAVPTGTCAASTLESQNCDDSNHIFTPDLCAHSETAGSLYYDDLVYTQTSVPARIWEAVASSDNVRSATPGIGINTDAPFDAMIAGVAVPAIDVVGNVRATPDPVNPAAYRGEAHSPRVCDPSGSNCFSPAAIGGAESGMNCETGVNRGMNGIARSEVTCGPTFPPGSAGSCAPGQYVIGFDSAGQIICALIP
ncbi:MAG: type II secretion system protein [Alphaproteobacteria bacterium]